MTSALAAAQQPPAAPAKPPAAKPPAAAPAKPPAAAPAKPPAAAAPAKPPAAAPAKPPATAPAKPPTVATDPAKPPGAGDPPPDDEPEVTPPEGGNEPPPPTTGKGPSGPSVSPTPAPGQFGPMPMWPQPANDAAALEKQGKDPAAPKKAKSSDEIYAEDWWSHARPIFEIHGYFRLRAELFHNFSLGKVDAPNAALWPMPADNHYSGRSGGAFGPSLCTGDESAESGSASDNPKDGLYPCKNKTQAGANLRFRLNPELHISDNLRVMSQIDMLDNLVLGSTPEGYSNSPSDGGGYRVTQRSGYSPIGAFDNTQSPPSDGRNSYRDSIRVKRAWAEYMTPVGQLRFGRMPSHWGLGILSNAGDGADDDYQSTNDRIMFMTGLKSLDLYLGGAWDFTNEGATSDSLGQPQAQPYDLGQLDDVDQYVFVIARRKNAELTKLALAQGNLVLNGGAYVVHRRQLIANDTAGACAGGAPTLGCPTENVGTGYVRRGATAWIPDLWLQLLYKKFRFEAEVVTVQGDIESTPDDAVNGRKIRMWGYAAEFEQKLVEDRLKLEFKTGWASGDPDVYGPVDGAGGLSPGFTGLQPQRGDDTISTFRFHPNYKVDLILHRNLLSRVQGTYYFRPSVEYDFIREASGQRFGGGFAGIWSRASEFVQTPGHKRDLGIELDLSLYYQSKDGSLNDNHDKPGGFYTMLQWGVLFPMGGLGYQEELEAPRLEQEVGAGASETSTAQILRWYMGVLF